MKSLTFIEIDNTDDARDVSIPDPSVVGLGAEVVVKDGSGGAATHNITITPEAGEIDGDPTYVISDDGACVTMRSDGVKWVVTSTSGVGGAAPAGGSNLVFGGFMKYVTSGAGSGTNVDASANALAQAIASTNDTPESYGIGGIPVPPGTAKNLRVALRCSSDSNHAVATATVYKNGVVTALTVSVSGGPSGHNINSSDMISFVEGDVLQIKITGSFNDAGDATSPAVRASVEFAPA